MRLISSFGDFLPWVVVAFIATALASLVLTPVVRRFAIRLDNIDQPEERRVNVRPVPRGGGIAVAASFLLLTGEVSAAIVNFANGLAQMIATIASLTLAAQCVPRRAEGFAFAGLMSVSNLADICSINAGAFLYEHVFDGHLAPLVIVAAATTAIAAVLVPWLGLRSKPVDSPV